MYLLDRYDRFFCFVVEAVYRELVVYGLPFVRKRIVGEKLRVVVHRKGISRVEKIRSIEGIAVFDLFSRCRDQ